MLTSSVGVEYRSENALIKFALVTFLCDLQMSMEKTTVDIVRISKGVPSTQPLPAVVNTEKTQSKSWKALLSMVSYQIPKKPAFVQLYGQSQ
jgi:hypothetical protein